MKTSGTLAVALTALCALACNGGDEEKYEKIDKLRALGVSVTPIGLTPSTAAEAQTVTMTFFVAAPLDSTVTYEPYEDEQARYALPVTLAVDPGSEKHDDYAKFSIHQVNAVFTAPAADSVPIPSVPGFARIRYGLRVKSAGEEEVVVGTLVMYPTAETRPAYQPLTVNIETPIEGATIGSETPVEAIIDNQNGENVKVGWFVSSGELKNRRARKTEWRKVEGGTQTVVVTVRGLKSGAFAYAVRDVTGP
jgi:hypothetical protein